ncbi:hypothetical protein [Actinoplanes sp. NPDC049802]|uniref:hypothetical protein n=1 Tax=Actinoplanes sp. NPDC049802 TaxID=3154742 RepID=UPI0033DA74EC
MSEKILRVDWMPGSDRLHGRCHCRAEAEADDPIALWEWLQSHPDHPPDGPAQPAVTPLPRPPAHVVTEARRIRREVPRAAAY